MKKILAGISLGTMLVSTLNCGVSQAKRSIKSRKATNSQNNKLEGKYDIQTVAQGCLINGLDNLYDAIRVYENSEILDEISEDHKETAKSLKNSFLSQIDRLDNNIKKMNEKCHYIKEFDRDFSFPLEGLKPAFKATLEEKLKKLENTGGEVKGTSGVSLDSIEILKKLIGVLR